MKIINLNSISITNLRNVKTSFGEETNVVIIIMYLRMFKIGLMIKRSVRRHALLNLNKQL